LWANGGDSTEQEDRNNGKRGSVILGILGFKGGVGKTTAAVHLAGFLNESAPTCLIDCDPNHSALAWARKGRLPFPVVSEEETARVARKYHHLVIDAKARPTRETLAAVLRGSDFLILPTTPDSLSIDALLQTVEALGGLAKGKYRVLLNICPPYPSTEPEQARALLMKAGFPLFRNQIRRSVAFQRAPLVGGLVQDTGEERAGLCAADYAAIGTELLELMKGEGKDDGKEKNHS
jgi:chromosome partitioning protein